MLVALATVGTFGSLAFYASGLAGLGVLLAQWMLGGAPTPARLPSRAVSTAMLVAIDAAGPARVRVRAHVRRDGTLVRAHSRRVARRGGAL